jgi:catechol 2,3-dioxygenase-like lactoylglutathione lyase family enzyme
MANPRQAVLRHHHQTPCVGDAQQDYDFHARLLGLKSVKKTALFDGVDSVYVCTPGSAQFEAAVSQPDGFLTDEPFEILGTEFQIPPVFADRKDDILACPDPPVC